ncbi:hypothetical protein BGZ93_007158 [Podila epicladia]|nr:hypothetical protein BGZ93_007158 [Podila epicladia]
MAQCPASESSTMLSTENSSTNLPDTTAQPSPPTPPQEPVPAKHVLQPQPQPQERLQPQEQLQPQSQPGQSKQARPVSEIFSNHIPVNGKSFQSPEAEAIDKWFEDLSHYEQTLEEMAVVSLDHVFKEELSTIESWFNVLSEAERTAALYSLLQHSSQVQIRFFITVLQQLAKKDPVGALLSPTGGEKDPAQTQLHGAMVKAEKEVSQRLLSVLPIQPPTTSSLDRPTAGRRLYDRHSMTMGESEEYSRLFRRDNKRNSDILGLSNHLSSHPANTTGGLGNGIPHINTNNTNNTNTSNTSNSNSNSNSNVNSKPNGASGPIGSGGVFSEADARVNHFKLPVTSLSSSNRVSAPLFSNRPKSVCEGDASSIFSSNWNFASLGGTPIAGPSIGPSSGTSGSPGNIGDRTSLGRPKSVGGAEWMLSSTTNPQPGADGAEKSWTPLLMSPTMGGFHGGSNGTGHSFGSSSGYSGSSLAVERPKSVTEADLAKLNISQWSINGPNNNLLGSRSDDPMKPNRRRTLLRPSAIISNVPVTVLEGDEKLLSASANTSSINIVSSLFDEPGSSTGTMPSLTSALTASQAPSMFQYSSQAFSQPPQHLPLQQQQQQQQYYQQQQVSPLSSLSLQSQPAPHYQQHASSRAQSPMTSPLPSPITSGFRSRPASRPTSPGLTAHHNYASVRNVWSSNGNHGYNHHNSYNNYNNHYQHGNMMGHHPMDYHQKRHLSPPDVHSRGTSVLDDDYMSDTSDMSSLGMNPHRSMGKDKKQYEGVDFELLQDTPAWLRSLRLHKYNSIFEGMNWREIVNLSDGDLINKGVAALGARRKMLKVFEQVRKEMLLQGMTI